MFRSASAAVLSSNHSHGIRSATSNRSLFQLSSHGTLNGNASTPLPTVKAPRKIALLALCVMVLVGSVLISMSIMVGHSGSTAIGAHQHPAIKLVITDIQQGEQLLGTGAPRSKHATAGKHEQDTSTARSNAADLEQASGSSAAGSSGHQLRDQLEAAHTLPKAAAAAVDYAVGRHHTQSRERQQAGKELARGRSSAEVASFAVPQPTTASRDQDLVAHLLPEVLPEKPLKQHVAVVSATVAAAAYGGAATNLPHDDGLQAAALAGGVHPDDATSKYIAARGIAPTRLKYPVWWHGPIWAGSGYGSEAINFILSLVRTGRLAPADVWAHHHGDGRNEAVVNALAPADKEELDYLQSLPSRYGMQRAAIVVCHSVPTNWAFPTPMSHTGAPCPPNPREFGWVYMVGRTMFETDRLPAVFVPRLNAMNEIWVPSEWQRASFIASGVAPEKLVVIPEGVNTTQFDPSRHTPMDLATKAQLTFGKPWEVKLTARQHNSNSPASNSSSSSSGVGGCESDNSAADSFLEHDVIGQSPWLGQQQLQSDVEVVDRSGTEQSAVVGDSDRAGSSSRDRSSSSSRIRASKPFRFISTFKWELRKGWDVLLEAYLSEFTAEDDVELYILTKPFDRSGTAFTAKMQAWAQNLHAGKDIGSRQKQIAGAAGKFTFVTAGGWRRLQRQQQQQHEQVKDSEWFPQSEECTGSWGSANCTAAAAAGTAAAALVANQPAHSVGPYAADSVSVLGIGVAGRGGSVTALDQHAKAHAHHVGQQIKQFALKNFGTAPVAPCKEAGPQKPQLRQRRLLDDTHVVVPPAANKPVRSGDTDSAAAAKQQQRPSSKLKAEHSTSAAEYPTLYVVDRHISDADFPCFYKAGDAFVLPTRGEGWGRPQVEAMAMGLPVISTNWSGITAYLDESVGYPLAVERLVPVQGSEGMWWFKGLHWAQPSVAHLRQLMRRVYCHRHEAAARGRAARQLMLDKYSPEPLADLIVKELQRIEASIP